MKPREIRRNAIIAARLRNGNAWCDAHILNLSSRGLLLHAAPPPPRGAYVEVRRGTHVIVARVMWASDDRFGVQTQDLLAIDSLIANGPPDTPSTGDSGQPPVDRRARQRSDRLEWRHERSREKGRALEFAGIAGFGLSLAICAYLAVSEALSQPLSEVAMHLGGAR